MDGERLDRAKQQRLLNWFGLHESDKVIAGAVARCLVREHAETRAEGVATPYIALQQYWAWAMP